MKDDASAPAYVRFPTALPLSAYETAVARYCDAVASRAGAVYQVGNVRFPGLSDIDLVVVVSRPVWDNNQFFSPFVRLPRHEQGLFHHEPRFLPATCLDTIAYSSCVHAASPNDARAGSAFGSGRRLIAGSDLLGPLAVDVGSPDWQRCRVLEIAFTVQRVLGELAEPGSVDVVKLVSRATALRYPMRHLHDLLGVSPDAEYERRIDAARVALLEPQRTIAERHDVARTVHRMFEMAARRYIANVRTLFELRKDDDVQAAAAAILSGGRSGPGIDAAYIARRLNAAARYQAGQRAFCIGTGSIFATKPYNGAYRRYRQPFVQRIASSARWRWAKPDYGFGRPSEAKASSTLSKTDAI